MKNCSCHSIELLLLEVKLGNALQNSGQVENVIISYSVTCFLVCFPISCSIIIWYRTLSTSVQKQLCVKHVAVNHSLIVTPFFISLGE